MLFDSLMLAVVAREIGDACQRRRVQRVVGPNYTDVYLAFRGGPAVCLSMAPDLYRVHLASETPRAPATPTPFCQALRKHLEGAVLVRTEQLRFDRVLFLHFADCGGFGPKATTALVAEPTGRLANMMLLDTATPGDPEIIVCAKHVTKRVNRYREVLPGAPYVPPPGGGRLSPRGLDADRLRATIAGAEPSQTVGDFLGRKCEGASTDFVAEVLCRAELSPETPVGSLEQSQAERLCEVLRSLACLECDISPAIYQPPSGRAFAYPIALQHVPGEASVEPMPSLSAALERVAAETAGWAALRTLQTRLEGALSRALKRARVKLQSREAQLEEAQQAEQEKRLGELMLAQAAQIPAGASTYELVDFYRPEQPTITVALNPLLTAARNAQQHFLRYRKAKTAQERLPRLVAEARQEVEYLAGLQPQVEMAQELSDLQEIEAELAAQGYLKAKARPKRAQREPAGPRVRSVASPDGYTVYYGRTNTQNEHLLRHIAGPDDLWLHVQGAPGGHVVVKRQGKGAIPRKTIETAAHLAAENSQLRGEGIVPVDYTQRKYVTKPRGGKPGFVHYTHAKTILMKLERKG